MNNKIYFLSFADKRFKSTKRIEREAHDFGIFTDVLVGDESMLQWYLYNISQLKANRLQYAFCLLKLNGKICKFIHNVLR